MGCGIGSPIGDGGVAAVTSRTDDSAAGASLIVGVSLAHSSGYHPHAQVDGLSGQRVEALAPERRDETYAGALSFPALTDLWITGQRVGGSGNVSVVGSMELELRAS